MVSHCGFDFNFPNSLWYGTSLHITVGQFYNFFGEMYIYSRLFAHFQLDCLIISNQCICIMCIFKIHYWVGLPRVDQWLHNDILLWNTFTVFYVVQEVFPFPLLLLVFVIMLKKTLPNPKPRFILAFSFKNSYSFSSHSLDQFS